MRYSTTLAAIIIFISVFYACERDDNDFSSEYEKPDFILTADKDGGFWMATHALSYMNIADNKFTFFGALVDSFSFQEEIINISIDIDELTTGEKLHDFDATWISVIWGDILGGRYEKAENEEESYIIFSKLDTVNHRIIGTFEIKLKNAGSSDEYYMTFKNGSFDLPIKDIDTIK